jgi:4-amino-4-deoxy-L-arabinose transferase-like glycosyltransferase
MDQRVWFALVGLTALILSAMVIWDWYRYRGGRRPAPAAQPTQTSQAAAPVAAPEPAPVSTTTSGFTVLPEAVLLLGGLGLASLSQGITAALPEDARQALTALTVMGLASLLLGAQFVRAGGMPGRLVRPLARAGGWLGIQAGQVLSLAISPLFAVIAHFAAGDTYKAIQPGFAVAAWLVGIAFAVIGGWQAIPGALRPSRRTAIWLAVLVSAALLLRGIDIAHIPNALSGDEASLGLNALSFLRGELDNLFIVSWFSFPSLHAFIQAASIRLLGQTVEALRFPAVIAGTLSVGALYLVGKAMFGQRTGLLAAVFLAALHLHIHFSRIGLNNIWDGLGYTVTLGALWYGWHSGRRTPYVIAGLGLGLSQYFYVTSRLLLVLIPAWLVLAGLFDFKRLKRALPNLLIMGVVALVCYLPLGWFYNAHPDEYMAPLNRVSIMTTDQMLQPDTLRAFLDPQSAIFENIKRSAQVFTAIPPIGDFYEPGTPLLQPVAAALFLLGASLLLLQWRDGRTLLLGLWLILIVLTGAFAQRTPAAQRYVAAAPACALILSYGLTELSALLSRIWPQRARAFTVASTVLLVGVAANDVRFYFMEQTPRSYFSGATTDGEFNTAIADRLARYLQGKSSEWQVVFFGYPRMNFQTHASVRWIAPHIQGIDMTQPWGIAGNPQPTSDHLIFVLLPGHEINLPGVQASYPGGRLLEQRGHDGRLLYTLYEVPAVGD